MKITLDLRVQVKGKAFVKRAAPPPAEADPKPTAEQDPEEK